MLAFGDTQNVDVKYQDLELAEKTIYDDHVVHLSKFRRCCLCNQRFRLSHNAGIIQHTNQFGHARDHIEYETEPASTWHVISINRRVLQCLQQIDILAHINLEEEDTQVINIIRIIYSE